MNEVVVKSIAKIIARRSVQVNDVLQNSYPADESEIWAKICKANSEKTALATEKKWYFCLKMDFIKCKRAISGLQRGGRKGRRPRESKVRGHQKSEITKITFY